MPNNLMRMKMGIVKKTSKAKPMQKTVSLGIVKKPMNPRKIVTK